MPYFPVFLDLRDKLVVVVGAGKVATRKVESLLPFSPRIKVVADRVSEDIRGWANEGKVELVERKLRLSDLKGAFMVIVAVDDLKLQKKVYGYCKKHKILCNAVDSPEFCTFLFPALVLRGDLVVGVSTSGKAPAVSRFVRERLEEFLPKELKDVVEKVEELRRSMEKGEERQRKVSKEAKRLVDGAFLQHGGSLSPRRKE